MYTRRPQFRRVRTASSKRALSVIDDLKVLPDQLERGTIKQAIKHVKYLSNEIKEMLGLDDYLKGVETALRMLSRAGFTHWTDRYESETLERRGISSDDVDFIFSALSPDIMAEDLSSVIVALGNVQEESPELSHLIEKLDFIGRSHRTSSFEAVYNDLVSLNKMLKKLGYPLFSPKIVDAYARVVEVNAPSLDDMGLALAGVRGDEKKELRDTILSFTEEFVDFRREHNLWSSDAAKPARIPAPRKRRAPTRRRAPEPEIIPEIIPEPPRKRRAPASRTAPAGSKRAPAGMPKGLVELATFAKSRKIAPSYTSNSVILSNGSEISTRGGQFHITRPNGSTFSSWEIRDIMAIIRQDA